MALGGTIVMTASTVVPATPDTGRVRVYINTGGTLSSVDDAGVITTYGAGLTQEQVEDIVGGLLQDSSTINVTYNDAGNVLTMDVIPSAVDHDALLNFVANEHVDHSTVSITAGTGLTGGGDITASRTLSLANTTVTAGSYGSSSQVGTFTVDAQGRLTAASNVSISASGIGAQPADADLTALAALAGTGLVTRTAANTFTTRTVTAGTGVSVSNGDGVSGNPTVGLSNVGTAGTYGSTNQVPVLTTNAQGQVSSVTNTNISIPASQVSDFSEAVDDRVAALIVAGTGITATYNDPSNTLTLATTITQYTDEQAQDTVASLIQNGTGISWSYSDVANTLTPSITLSPFSTTNLTEGTNLYFTDERAQDAIGSALTDSSSIDFSYNDVANTITAAVLPGGVNHNGLQNYVANEHVNHSSVSITAGTGLTGGGDITTSRTLSIANTGVTAGTYGSTTQVPVITVNAQGQLTVVTTATLSANPWLPVATGIRYQNDTGNDVIIEQIGTSGSAYLQFRSARGTIASPSFLLSGDRIGGWGGQGWNGTAFDSLTDGEFELLASENHSATAKGTHWIFTTTPNGTTTPLDRLQIENSGSLNVLTNPIINVQDPTNAQDAATKAYVDAQVNAGWTELVTTSDLTNASNVTYTAVTPLNFAVVSGRRYRIEALLMFRSAATTTGIAWTMNTTNTAAGTFSLLVQMPQVADANNATFAGTINALGDVVTSTSVQTANANFITSIQGVFVASASGTLSLQFRSEVNGSTVTVASGSSILVKEFV